MAKIKLPSIGWLKLDDSRYQLGENYGDWFSALSIRTSFKTRFEHANEDTAFSTDSFWESYCYATSKESITGFNAKPRILPLEEITASSLRKNYQSIAEWEMDIQGRRLLSVDLEYSDEELIRSFMAFLGEARKISPLPIKLRGKKSLNATLTPKHLSSWQRYRILAVFDLDFWVLIYSHAKFSHSELANCLAADFKRDDPKDWGREAREKLDEALASFALLAEKSGEKY